MKAIPSTARGVALVITLVFLVVITVLTVGFAVNMRMERSAAAAMSNSERAKILAHNAIEHATAILENNIPQPIPPGQVQAPRNWIVNPGLLTTYSGPDESEPTSIPLSTNADSTAPTENYTNLNAPGAGTADYPIIGSGEEIRASWVHVLEDPLAPAGPDNQVTGRYAFWIDDESAKINLNMAYGKPANLDLAKVNPLQQVTDLALYGTDETDPHTDPHAAEPDAPNAPAPNYNTYEDLPNVDPPVYPVPANLPPPKIVAAQMSNSVGSAPAPRYFPLWHPSAINLDLLGADLDREALSDWLYNASSAPSSPNWIGSPDYRLLTAPDQVKQFIAADADQFLRANKFFLTTSGRSPEFNVFGKSRIFLERRFPDQVNAYDRPHPNQPIFFQADYDAAGPTYFHGYENRSFSGVRSNITGIQHVADAISDLLDRRDWPGMPPRSFVDKWNGGTIGRLEADQVAMNIAIMGQYAAGWYNRVTDGKRDRGWMEGIEPVSSWLLGFVDPANAASTKWPGSYMRKGKLSQKAIVPHLPRPMVNEIVVTITPEVPDSPPSPAPTYGPNQEYRLRVTLQVEFYLPEKVPLTHIKGQFNQKFQMTHLEYTVEGTNAAGAPVVGSQTASSYIAGQGIRRLNGALGPAKYSITGAAMKNTVHFPVRPGSYNVMASSLPNPNGTDRRDFVIRADLAGAKSDGTNLSHTTGAIGSIPANNRPPSNTSAPLYFAGPVIFSGSFRLVTCTGGNDAVQQAIPVWDNEDGSAAMVAPAGMSDRIPFRFALDLGSLGPSLAGGQSVTRSIHVKDARLGGLASQWKIQMGGADEMTVDTLGGINPETPPSTYEKAAYFDSQNAFYSESPRGSIGMLSTVPTNMQRAQVTDTCETLRFQPSGGKDELPDWLLLDLLCPSIWPHTVMNSTLGKVNINAKIYPESGVDRWAPLQAVFQHMRPDTTVSGNSVSLSKGDASGVVQNILEHRLASAGRDFGIQGKFDYLGELCEIAGVADTGGTDWEKEALIRNLANILTTQSNTFSVWGVAQSIKKKPGSSNPGSYEPGDTITAEKRFHAIIERHVWPGRDGVAGNGHVDTSASSPTYDRLASTAVYPTARVPWDFPNPNVPATTQWSAIDGPDAPTYIPTLGNGQPAAVPNLTDSNVGLRTADNPLRAQMTYRVISFIYIAE